MTTMVDERPDTDTAGTTAGDPPTAAGFTPYRYGEDYPDAGAGLCWDFTILCDRVFVCVRPESHTEGDQRYGDDHRYHSFYAHAYVRMHRDPAVTFSSIAKSLEDDIP